MNKAIRFKELLIGKYFELFAHQYDPPLVYKKVEAYGTQGRRSNAIPSFWVDPNTWIIEVKK